MQWKVEGGGGGKRGGGRRSRFCSKQSRGQAARQNKVTETLPSKTDTKPARRNTQPTHTALGNGTDWHRLVLCGPPDLQLVKSILGTPNFVQCHSNIAAQHTGALVDEQAAPEVVLCHLILLLPEVDLAHPIPVTQHTEVTLRAE